MCVSKCSFVEEADLCAYLAIGISWWISVAGIDSSDCSLASQKGSTRKLAPCMNMICGAPFARGGKVDICPEVVGSKFPRPVREWGIVQSGIVHRKALCK